MMKDYYHIFEDHFEWNKEGVKLFFKSLSYHDLCILRENIEKYVCYINFITTPSQIDNEKLITLSLKFPNMRNVEINSMYKFYYIDDLYLIGLLN